MMHLDKPGKSRLYLWILLFSFILPLAALNAEQIDAQRWKVNVGATETITGPDGVCQKVTNNSPNGLAIFVPIKTAVEWQAFLGHLPTGVSVGSCCVPVGCGGRCGWVDNGCGTLIDCGSCQQTWTPPIVCRPAGCYQVIHGQQNAQDFCASQGMSYVSHTDGTAYGHGGIPWAGDEHAVTRRDGVPLDSILVWYAAQLEGVPQSELQAVVSVTCTR